SGLFGIELEETSAPPADRGAPRKKPRAAAQPSNPGRRLPAPPPPAKPKIPSVRPRRKTVTAAELIARGIPRHAIQNWLGSGVLLRTDQRGVYRNTKSTEERIAEYLSRIPVSGKKK